VLGRIWSAGLHVCVCREGGGGRNTEEIPRKLHRDDHIGREAERARYRTGKVRLIRASGTVTPCFGVM